MIVPDTNLLIYAYDTTAPQHSKSRKWWEDVLSGTEPVGIPWVVVLAFVRLMTHTTLSENPMTVDQSRRAVDSWLELEHVRLLSTEPTTLKRFFGLLDQAGMGGNLSTDAMIAALAQEHGGRLYSNDSDFNRFAGLTWSNPLA